MRRFLLRHHRPISEETLPLTPEQKDRLLIEVVMGVPEKDSKVPFTSESRKMRRNLRAEVREMRKNGFMPDIVKD